jgi:hypothetical protein
MAAANPSGKLHVTVFEAKELPDANLIGKMSVYCELSCGPEKFKTTTDKNCGVNANWNQAFIFNLNGAEDQLHVVLVADGTIGDNKLGRLDIKLDQLLKTKQNTWHNLVSPTNFTKAAGAILLQCYMEGAGPAVPAAHAVANTHAAPHSPAHAAVPAAGHGPAPGHSHSMSGGQGQQMSFPTQQSQPLYPSQAQAQMMMQQPQNQMMMGQNPMMMQQPQNQMMMGQNPMMMGQNQMMNPMMMGQNAMQNAMMMNQNAMQSAMMMNQNMMMGQNPMMMGQNPMMMGQNPMMMPMQQQQQQPSASTGVPIQQFGQSPPSYRI